MPVSNDVGNVEVQMDRRFNKDRRSSDSPQVDTPANATAGKPARRKKQRRRQIDPTTCERDYTADEIEFMQALDAYKRSSGRMFPTCSEILEVVRSIGYVKLTEEEQQLLKSLKEMDEVLNESQLGENSSDQTEA